MTPNRYIPKSLACLAVVTLALTGATRCDASSSTPPSVANAVARPAKPPSVPGAVGLGALKLDSVRLSFGPAEQGPTTKFVKPGDPIPAFKAVFKYTGTGTVRGRWEAISPAESVPAQFFVLPESQLREQERAQLRPYQLLGSFLVQLPPLGTFTLDGPDPRKMPRDPVGAHRIVLRIEGVESHGAMVTQPRLPLTPIKLHILGGNP